MTKRVRRGLGLLVVAALLLLVAIASLNGADAADSAALQWPLVIVGGLAALAFWPAVIVGLVYLALGLLRDERPTS